MKHGSAPLKTWRYARLTYITVVTCWIAYALLTIFAPNASNARYHMTETQLILLRLSLIVPVHLIWLVAARSVTNFKYYAALIRDGREGPGISNIATGLLWTLAYLIALTLGNAVLPHFTHASYYTALVVIKDHLSPLLALIAFYLLYRGSQQLKLAAEFITWTRSSLWILIAYAVFAFFFVLEFATSPATGVGTQASSTAIVPHGLLLFTLIMPYILAWFLGILAIVNLAKYSRQVKGSLYRQALENLVKGIGAVIFFTIIYQVFVFAVRYLTNISLGAALLLVYCILVLYGLGFVFVRKGAKKLMLLEVAQ